VDVLGLDVDVLGLFEGGGGAEGGVVVGDGEGPEDQIGSRGAAARLGQQQQAADHAEDEDHRRRQADGHPLVPGVGQSAGDGLAVGLGHGGYGRSAEA